MHPRSPFLHGACICPAGAARCTLPQPLAGMMARVACWLRVQRRMLRRTKQQQGVFAAASFALDAAALHADAADGRSGGRDARLSHTFVVPLQRCAASRRPYAASFSFRRQQRRSTGRLAAPDPRRGTGHAAAAPHQRERSAWQQPRAVRKRGMLLRGVAAGAGAVSHA